MKKLVLLIASVVLAGSVQAALFSDDFSTDTSANYVTTTTFGSGTPTHNVGTGTLNLVGAASTTQVVMHKTAMLEVGETVSIDVISGPNNLYLDISNTLNGGDPTGPNAGDGIRLQWHSSGIRGRVYNSGTGVNSGYIAAGVTPSTLWISRDTATTFSYGYDAVTHS